MSSHNTLQTKIRSNYRSVILSGLIISLIFFIAAFNISPQHEIETIVPPPDLPEDIDIIIPTVIKNQPPPPPLPPIPILAEQPIGIDDPILPDVSIFNAPIPLPPPHREKPKIEDEVLPFTPYEVAPEPIGGFEAIMKKINYPELDRRIGTQGKVLVEATIDQKGKVINAIVIKGISKGCDEEAIKAIKETKFKPALQRGKPVIVRVTIPIHFKLN